MKKIIFFVFALACIATVSYAQDEVKEIKPFKPSAEDAAKIRNILSKMDKSSYSVVVNQNNKRTNYGALDKARVKTGVAISAPGSSKMGTWFEKILEKIITKTKGIDLEAVAQLQAIAAKY